MTAWNRFRSKEKMGNVRSGCTLGHSHRSKLEASVCGLIALRQKAGELELLAAEEHVYLSEARIAYVADFKCLDVRTGQLLYVEAKGHETPRWPIIKKLWRCYGPAPLEIWKGTHLRPMLDETIIPKDCA